MYFGGQLRGASLMSGGSLLFTEFSHVRESIGLGGMFVYGLEPTFL